MNDQAAPTENDIVLLFDIKLRRPACVLLQAMAGCGHNNFLEMNFDSRDWLTAPTPDMRKVRGTREEWKRIAAKAQRPGGRVAGQT